MDPDRLRSAYDAVKDMAGGKRKPLPYAHMVKRCQELLYGIDWQDTAVLDVGAGNGFLSHYLASYVPVRSVTALDEYAGHGSPVTTGAMIAAMQERLQNADRLAIVRQDFLQYTPAVPFDRVVFVNVLHHIVNHRAKQEGRDKTDVATDVLRHAVRCLGAGGQVVIQELSNRNWCFLPGYRAGMGHVDWATKLPPSLWRRALARAGFDDIRVRYRLPLNLPRWNGLRLFFDTPVASVFADSSFVITARRPST